MTVIQTIVGTVKPGRYDDHIALAHEAEKLLERHGGREIRLLAAGLAGEATGNWALGTQFADLEAFGAFSDDINTDPDLLSLMTRVRGVDAPSTIIGMSLSTEIPTGRTAAPGRGSVIEVYLSRCAPGRFEEAVALGVTVCDLVEANGAMNGRLSTMQYAGSGTDLLTASWEWANMRDFGKGAAMWQRDTKAQEIAAGMYAADAPVTMTFSGLYNVIPL